MNIEIIEHNIVTREQQKVGTIGPDGEFYPVEGLHHKTVEKIRKQVSELQGGESASRLAHNQETEGSIPSPATIPDSDPQPERGELGDIAPELIEWRKRNWPMDAFSELYPPHRLKALNREDLL